MQSVKRAIPAREAVDESFAKTVEAELAAFHFPDLDREAPPPARAILLTGATGGLGAHLLHEIASNPELEAHVLVRAASEEHARDRIASVLTGFRLSLPPESWARVIPVLGNLTAPRLGLPPRDYAALTFAADTVLHSAANTSFIAPYDISRKANVVGTGSLLQLAASGRRKSFHQVSSCAVRLPPAYPDTASDIGLYNGYAKSKLVSEEFVQLARAKGLAAVSYGIGYLHIDYDGIDATDSFESLLRLFIEYGQVPLMDVSFDYTPVRFAAKAIVDNVTRRGFAVPKLDLHHPVPLRWADIVAAVMAVSPGITALPFADFLPGFHAFMERYRGMKVFAIKSSCSRDFPFQLSRMFGGVKSSLANVPAYDRARLEHVVRHIVGTYRWL